MGLQLRLYLLIGLMLAVLYGVVLLVGQYLGLGSFMFYGIIAGGMVLLQFMIGPWIVGFSMKVKEVSEAEQPELHRMVAELSQQAGIKKPRVCISALNVPNAFAYGHTSADARVCVTKGIMGLLNRNELRAVIGHELSHVKSNDVAFITLLSVLPMICYYLGYSLMWSRSKNGSSLAMVGMVMLLLYFVTNLLVLYGSRIREYYADKGSVRLGNQPNYLASALYKLASATGRVSQEEKRQVDGAKAFFISDPTASLYTVRDLRDIDLNHDGVIDQYEMATLNQKNVKVGGGEAMMEIFGTHPNMLKRIKSLSQYAFVQA